MRTRLAFAVALAALLVVVTPRLAATQAIEATDPLAIALAAEDAGRLDEAAGAYRRVLARALGDDAAGDQVALALLGLERVWTEGGRRDSLLPVVRSVLAARPADPVARSIEFRIVADWPGDTALAAAFDAWRAAAPREAAPYREYARLLIAAGRMADADSVLQRAARTLGDRREVAGEMAQLQVALERWGPAASAWRDALAGAPWLETPALFALGRAPAAFRDSVRAPLRAPPALLPVRRLLAGLELAWGDPRAAWRALAEADGRDGRDSVVVAWREFAERAEFAGDWSVARDVWRTILDRAQEPEAAVRAAEAALRLNDAEGALALLARAAGLPAPPAAARTLPLTVRALGLLGRADEAARLADRVAPTLDPVDRERVERELVTTWLRAGDVDRARAVAARTGMDDDDAVAGWIALYGGDLAGARRRLVRLSAAEGPLVEALAVLARTRIATHPGLGEAFLALARRDTLAAEARFVALADSLDDAAPAIVAVAARLAAARGDARGAAARWDRLVAGWPGAPEIPEALLESARARAAAGDRDGALARYEQLLVDHPDSALAPQARLERERLAGRVPGGRP